MTRISVTLVLLLCYSLLPASVEAQTADRVLTDAVVWTGDDDNPQAEAIAIRGNHILAVGTAEEVAEHIGEQTDVMELNGAMVTPGFIDNHTHFNSAGALLLGINLLAVNDEETLADEVTAARDRLPDGAWITGGDWGAYAQWAEDPEPLMEPDRSAIDDLTPDTPVFLSRFDGEQFLANALALERAGLSCDDAGVDCEDGRMTGRLSPEAASQVRDVVPDKTMEQRLKEAHLAMDRLVSHGVTTIHDNTPPEQLRAFQKLRASGDLRTRIYARPTLDRWSALAETGISHGFGDDYLQIGGLKGFVDGILGNSTARFYEPYEHIDSRGIWRDMMGHPDGMQGLIEGASAAGHWPQIHAIGDQAIDTLLTMMESAREVAEASDQRWRVIHTQHLRGPEVADRMAEMDLIAEMQPIHAIDDMRWMEERIGEERARYTYAFRTLHEAGVMLSFGSDWPGTNASWYTSNPLEGIYAAVTRRTLEGYPEEGWIPEERIDVETALRAYTVNNAYAGGQEYNRGTIAPGYLADLAVLSENILEIDPMQLPHVEIRYTLLGGTIVYDHEAGTR